MPSFQSALQGLLKDQANTLVFWIGLNPLAYVSRGTDIPYYVAIEENYGVGEYR